MLLSNQIEELAQDLNHEFKMRPYARALVPQVIDDPDFWKLIMEVVEIVVHKRNLLIVSAEKVQGSKP
ncbi:MAG: hypothetical protein M3N19_06710 [Candidatus Eremiobacteraeota bacterium]|nr:hypothetical protein [Candidatus Eremiobacteraeota bacterium]